MEKETQASSVAHKKQKTDPAFSSSSSSSSKDLLRLEHPDVFVSKSPFLVTEIPKESAPKTLKTFKVEAPSVLSRLQEFLPSMAAANQQLKEQMKEAPREQFDIEHIEEGSGKTVIEMNLGMGVFDVREEVDLDNQHHVRAFGEGTPVLVAPEPSECSDGDGNHNNEEEEEDDYDDNPGIVDDK